MKRKILVIILVLIIILVIAGIIYFTRNQQSNKNPENTTTISTNTINEENSMVENSEKENTSKERIEQGSREDRGFIVDNILHSDEQGDIHFSSYFPSNYDENKESANDTIALVEYFLNNYNIDKSRVYISGVSGGGETLSIVLRKRPELFTSALYVSSQWDGDYEEQGLSNEEIDDILVLDLKEHEYFTSRGYSDEHAGCGSFAYEENIMNWVFSKN